MIHINIKEKEVPALGFGTYKLKDKIGAEAVSDAIAIGYRHIDTAEAYDNEEAVGQGIRDSGVARDELFVTTKIWYDHLKHDALIKAAETSLKKLRTDYVDLLLIHWPNKDVAMKEPLEALTELMQQGKVKLIGVSNFTCEMVDKAAALAPVACNQVEYHPFLSQQEMLKTIRGNDMFLTAYCPIAKGKVLDHETIKDIGAKYKKNAAQITLRWHVQQQHVAAIPKSSSAERRRENFEIFDFELTQQEMQAITALGSPEGRLVDPSWAPTWDC